MDAHYKWDTNEAFYDSISDFASISSKQWVQWFAYLPSNCTYCSKVQSNIISTDLFFRYHAGNTENKPTLISVNGEKTIEIKEEQKTEHKTHWNPISWN